MTDRTPKTTRTAVAPLHSREILRFYLPLVLTSQLLTLSGPLLNVILGRAAEPRLDLAAFWVAFTAVLLLESAALVVQPLTLALAGRPDAGRRLLDGALLVGIAGTLGAVALACTPIGEAVFQHVIPTTPRVAARAREVLLALAPAPFVIAMRGLASGQAILARRTTLVAVATTVRTGVTALAVVGTLMLGGSLGAIAAVWAYLAGIALEGTLLLAATAPGMRAPAARVEIAAATGTPSIARLAAPLALAMLVWTASRPAVNAVLGRLADPELAQAGFGIALPFLMVTCAPLWAFQEASLVLPRDAVDLRRLLRFAAITSGIATLAIAVLTLSPARGALLRLGFDLGPELERTVAPALALVVLEPIVLSVRAIAQGLLMRARRTDPFMVVAPARLGLTLVVGILIAAAWPRLNGVVLGVGLLVGGDLFEALAYGALAGRALAERAVFEQPRPGRAGWVPTVVTDEATEVHAPQVGADEREAAA